MTHSGLLSDFKSVQPAKLLDAYFLEDISDYLGNNFHAYFSSFQAAFVSEAVDIATPKDSATSIAVRWFDTRISITEQTSAASADESSTLEATLICTVCNNQTNPCFYKSLCQSNGVCECTTRASGTLCQIPPISNGW